MLKILNNILYHATVTKTSDGAAIWNKANYLEIKECSGFVQGSGISKMTSFWMVCERWMQGSSGQIKYFVKATKRKKINLTQRNGELTSKSTMYGIPIPNTVFYS